MSIYTRRTVKGEPFTHIKHLRKQRELLLDAADAAILGGDLSL